MKKFMILGFLALGACATNIQEQPDTIKPPTVPLGSFDSYILRPMTVEKAEAEASDPAAVEQIRQGTSTCLSAAFQSKKPVSNASEGNRVLLIEPVLVDLKRVGGATRVFTGALAGDSAVLMRTRYADAKTGAILAEPVFYSKASGMSGAWSMGGNDNAMLSRISSFACDYARQNM